MDRNRAEKGIVIMVFAWFLKQNNQLLIKYFKIYKKL